MDEFLSSNEWQWRLARTVVQGVIGVLVALAKSQVGYVPPVGKWNKYAEALDKTNPYNYAKNGYDWCDIFYDWCLVQEFGVEVAKAMTNQPSKGCGAGCAFSASYYRAMN